MLYCPVTSKLREMLGETGKAPPTDQKDKYGNHPDFLATAGKGVSIAISIDMWHVQDLCAVETGGTPMINDASENSLGCSAKDLGWNEEVRCRCIFRLSTFR